MISSPNIEPVMRLRWLHLYQSALKAPGTVDAIRKLQEVQVAINEHQVLDAYEKESNVRFTLLRRPRIQDKVRSLYIIED